jgi:DNA-binding Lrp family transcriptional regulator
MNDVTREILKKIQDKKTLDIISKEMNIGKATLKARVDSLIHQGFLGEITYGSGCKMCLMKCSSNICSSDIKMFTLTEKGRELVEKS